MKGFAKDLQLVGLYNVITLQYATQGFLNIAPKYDRYLRGRGHPLTLINEGTLKSEVQVRSLDNPPLEKSQALEVIKNPKALVVLDRAKQIISVLNEVVVPVGSSALKAAVNSSAHDKMSWDKFWSSSLPAKNYDDNGRSVRTSISITNAERVTDALEKLGPTYVKFGQAAASRVDLLPNSLTSALSKLQDRMYPFETKTAINIMKEDWEKVENRPNESTTSLIQDILQNISPQPVAAASVGQVYKSYAQNIGPVAIKVKRPGVQELVEADAMLLVQLAKLLEAIPALPTPLIMNIMGRHKDINDSQTGVKFHRNKFHVVSKRLIATELVGAVEEFMSRLFEELDYKNEVENAQKFGSLYGIADDIPVNGRMVRAKCKVMHRIRILRKKNPVGVVVPAVIPELCTERVIVMEWIEGQKLVASASDEGEIAETSIDLLKENLELLKVGIECTLQQLFDKGVLHCDPHGGNLLKVNKSFQTSDGLKEKATLAYLDFGLVAEIPEQVRDGLVCALSELVFSKNIDAVANLFGELQLLPEHVIRDDAEIEELKKSLDRLASRILVYPEDGSGSTVPALKFDSLLESLATLVPRFQFKLPPYFLNNARALGTLEGMARSIDPKFNVLQMVYPYALKRLLENPTNSAVVNRTLYNLVRSERGGTDWKKVFKLVNEISKLTQVSRIKVLTDIVTKKYSRIFIRSLVTSDLKARIKLYKSNRRILQPNKKKHRPKFATYLEL